MVHTSEYQDVISHPALSSVQLYLCYIHDLPTCPEDILIIRLLFVQSQYLCQ